MTRISVVLTLLFLRIFPVAAETAQSADRYVDSIGVNVHLHFTGTAYAAGYAGFKSLLVALGVRHIRDGLIDTTWQPYYDRLQELAALGIHSTLIAPQDGTAALFADYPRRVPGAMEAFEGVNEPNNPGFSWYSANWAARTLATQQALYQAAKASGTAALPVVGPSVCCNETDQAVLGDVSAYLDFGNIHNYPAGYNPGKNWYTGENFIEHEKRIASTNSGPKSILATETGYLSDPTQGQGVPANVMAKYVPRLFLEQFMHGIIRTHEYAFFDDAGQPFGLVQVGASPSDQTPKPAYYAIKNLISLLADPGPGFVTGSLVMTLNSTSSNVHHLLLQKRDGTFFLLAWLEVASWDPVQRLALPATPESVQLHVSSPWKRGTLMQFDDQGGFRSSSVTSTAGVFPLQLTDTITMIHLFPTSSACDLNGDGQVNATDLQMSVNQAIGVAACSSADLNQDAHCNALDVQREVSALLGNTCNTDP